LEISLFAIGVPETVAENLAIPQVAKRLVFNDAPFCAAVAKGSPGLSGSGHLRSHKPEYRI
jgi:hypothetical protein